jgi:hypothetical protein
MTGCPAARNALAWFVIASVADAATPTARFDTADVDEAIATLSPGDTHDRHLILARRFRDYSSIRRR